MRSHLPWARSWLRGAARLWLSSPAGAVGRLEHTRGGSLSRPAWGSPEASLLETLPPVQQGPPASRVLTPGVSEWPGLEPPHSSCWPMAQKGSAQCRGQAASGPRDGRARRGSRVGGRVGADIEDPREESRRVKN